MSFFEERAKMLEESAETADLYYTKNPHSTAEGEQYEVGCAALVFLRCVREGLRFALSSNDAAGGTKFDDLVLTWEHQQSRDMSALFVQLKNKTSAMQLTIDRASLLGKAKSNDFNIKMYSKSYDEMKAALGGHNCAVVLFTNLGISQDAQQMVVAQDPDSVSGLKLLQTGGQCYKLNSHNNDVMAALQGDDQFVDNFYLLCEQSNSRTVMRDIQAELELLLGADGAICERMCTDFCKSVGEWRNCQIFCDAGNVAKRQSVCLTKDWGIWLRMVDTYIKEQVTSCNSLVTRLQYSSVEAMEAHIRGRNPAWVRPPVEGAAALSATRAHQALRGERHIMASVALYTQLREKILRCWGRFCSWLVLVDDVEESYETLIPKEEELAVLNRRLVLVSYKGEHSFQDTCKSADIDDDCWKSLINVTVNLNSNSEHQSCCLKDLCDIEDLKAILDGKPEALVALSQLSDSVRMGQDLSPLPGNYIPRDLTSRMGVRKEFFSNLGEKEVCITDEESYKILMTQTVLKSTVRFEELEKCLSASDAAWPRVVVADISDLSAVESICRKYPNIVNYVLSHASDGWQILFIHRGTAKIRSYIEEQSKSLLQIVDGVSNRIIIEGKPGIGKSTMLLDMARQLKDNRTPWWILRMNLFNYSEVFYSCGSGDKASQDILSKAVHNTGNLGILERTLLEHCLRKHRHIICLVDGFDEVCPIYADICLQTLQALAPRRGKLLVTTRPSVTGRLEEGLGVVAHSLPPFSEKQLYSYHRWHGSKLGATKVVRDLLKIPLFSRMYAETLEGQIVVDDIVRLYETFFERKFIRLYEEKRGVNLFAPGEKKRLEKDRKEHEKQLGLLAHSHLFPKLEEPSISQSFSIDRDDLLMAGVIYEFIDDKPVFIHRTFAEYFLAKWCFLDSAVGMCANVYRRALSDSSLEFFVESFDRMASRGRPLLTAVLNGSESEVESLLKKGEKGEDPQEKDLMGRNSLHLAAAYSPDATILRLLCEHLEAAGVRGSVEVTREAGVDYRVGEAARTEEAEQRARDSGLVEGSGSAEASRAEETQPVAEVGAAAAALGERDGLLRWTPLRYAAERGNWRAVAELLQVGAQLCHLGDFRRNLLSPEWVWETFIHPGLLTFHDKISYSLPSPERRWQPQYKSWYKIEVGVTLACVEMSAEKFGAILLDANRRGHLEDALASGHSNCGVVCSRRASLDFHFKVFVKLCFCTYPSDNRIWLSDLESSQVTLWEWVCGHEYSAVSLTGVMYVACPDFYTNKNNEIKI